MTITVEPLQFRLKDWGFQAAEIESISLGFQNNIVRCTSHADCFPNGRCVEGVCVFFKKVAVAPFVNYGEIRFEDGEGLVSASFEDLAIRIIEITTLHSEASNPCLSRNGFTVSCIDGKYVYSKLISNS